MFIKNIHVSLFSINLCLEKGTGKSVFENVFVKYTKYGGSNTNTNTWFEIWSNTNTNTPYLYLYLYLQIQIRIWPQPCSLLGGASSLRVTSKTSVPKRTAKAESTFAFLRGGSWAAGSVSAALFSASLVKHRRTMSSSTWRRSSSDTNVKALKRGSIDEISSRRLYVDDVSGYRPSRSSRISRFIFAFTVMSRSSLAKFPVTNVFVIGSIRDAVGRVPEHMSVVVVWNGFKSSTAASAIMTSSVLRVLWRTSPGNRGSRTAAHTAACCSNRRVSMSWAEFQRVGTSWISFFTGNPNSSCFSFNTWAAPGLRLKWPTSFLALANIRDKASTLNARHTERFNVWAKQPTWSQPSCTAALVMLRALSVMMIGSLSCNPHSVAHSRNKSATWSALWLPVTARVSNNRSCSFHSLSMKWHVTVIYESLLKLVQKSVVRAMEVQVSSSLFTKAFNVWYLVGITSVEKYVRPGTL